jgi:hypothetical protein
MSYWLLIVMAGFAIPGRAGRVSATNPRSAQNPGLGAFSTAPFADEPHHPIDGKLVRHAPERA